MVKFHQVVESLFRKKEKIQNFFFLSFLKILMGNGSNVLNFYSFAANAEKCRKNLYFYNIIWHKKFSSPPGDSYRSPKKKRNHMATKNTLFFFRKKVIKNNYRPEMGPFCIVCSFEWWETAGTVAQTSLSTKKQRVWLVSLTKKAVCRRSKIFVCMTAISQKKMS